MAYTFTDPYRPVRFLLRIDGLLLGVGLGPVLFLQPASWLARLGLEQPGPLWSARIGGAALIGVGLGLLVAAGEQEMRMASLLTAMVSNGLIALALFLSYLAGELAGLNGWGVFAVTSIFAISLAMAVAPIPFLRRERQPRL